jgi:hypothetical protein
MRSASRQGRRWFAIVVALGAAAVAGSISQPAIANEPTDLRVVSVTRGDDGTVTVVVSVPAREVAAAGAPGALTVQSANGVPLTPTVTALPPSATAVAVILHTVGADVATVQRADGVAGELLRSLDPAIAVTVVSTAGGTVVAPLGVDRAASFAALAQPPAAAAAALPAAVGAVAGQFAGRGYVEPLVVVIDAAPVSDPSAALGNDPLATAGMGWRIIPLGAAPSPVVAQFAQRVGLTVPAAADPVSLVDDAVGMAEGRFSLSLPDPGSGALTVRLHAADADFAAPVALPAVATTTAAVASVPTTVVATTAATAPAPTTTQPVVLAERPVPSALVASPAPPSGHSSSSWWVPIVGGAVAVLGVGAGALVLGRRRSGRPDAEPAPVGAPSPSPAPTSAAVYHYTDLSEPLPSGAMRSRPRREIVARVPVGGEPAAAPRSGSSSAIFERRKRVLALAEELGNVSEACRVVGVSRRSYYEWKRIADEHGLEALRPKRER